MLPINTHAQMRKEFETELSLQSILNFWVFVGICNDIDLTSKFKLLGFIGLKR